MGKSQEKITEVGNDQAHLKEKSYKTAEKLNVRILTHQKYTEPEVNFYDWVLDQIEWTGAETVFDIGCGSGLYSEKASARSGEYYACDLSHGMLMDGAAENYQCVNLDAMTLPLPDDSADVILANHMIYHIPDRKRGVSEFRRVLKPTGKMTAVTNSRESMQELKSLRIEAMQRAVPGFSLTDENVGSNFDLESGDVVLKTAFDHVDLHILESWLVFPEPQPVIDYINSSRDWWEVVFFGIAKYEQFEHALHEILNEHFSTKNEYRVSKKTGVFVCW